MDQWAARKLTYARKMAEEKPAAMTEEFVDEWKRALIWAWFDFQSNETVCSPEDFHVFWGMDRKEGQDYFKEWIRDLRGYSPDEHGVSLKKTEGPCLLKGVRIEG